MSTVSSLSLANAISGSSTKATSSGTSSAATDKNAVSQSLFATQSSNGSSTFLTSTDTSAVQKMVDAQKTKVTQVTQANYFYSENYLRLAANEIHSRIVTYKNLGMTAQYSQAQQDGQVIVQEYQAYEKAKAAGLDTTQAIKDVQKQAQSESFAVAPSLLLSV